MELLFFSQGLGQMGAERAEVASLCEKCVNWGGFGFRKRLVVPPTGVEPVLPE